MATYQPQAIRSNTDNTVPDSSVGVGSRTGAFYGPPEGIAGTASLNADSARFQANVPRSFMPSSVLTPLNYSNNPGGNGMSADMAARRFADGTPMGSVNGTSESSFAGRASAHVRAR